MFIIILKCLSRHGNVFVVEPVSSKRYKLACALNEDSDQPVCAHRLIRVFVERYMGSQASSVVSCGILRL